MRLARDTASFTNYGRLLMRAGELSECGQTSPDAQRLERREPRSRYNP